MVGESPKGKIYKPINLYVNMKRIHIILDDKVEKKMREIKVRKKGDISTYIGNLIKKDLKIK